MKTTLLLTHVSPLLVDPQWLWCWVTQAPWVRWGTHPQLFHSKTQHCWSLETNRWQMTWNWTRDPTPDRIHVIILTFMLSTHQQILRMLPVWGDNLVLYILNLTQLLGVKASGLLPLTLALTLASSTASWHSSIPITFFTLWRTKVIKNFQNVHQIKNKSYNTGPLTEAVKVPDVTLATDMPMVPVPQHTSSTVLFSSSWAHSPTAE